MEHVVAVRAELEARHNQRVKQVEETSAEHVEAVRTELEARHNEGVKQVEETFGNLSRPYTRN